MARETLAETERDIALPTMYDLPSEDPEEPGLPDEFHALQPQLSSETFKPSAVDPDRCFTAMDMNLYYDPANTLWHKRPDWFAVIDVPRFYGEQKDLRLSYVFWQERVAPYLVIELLSPGTEDEDLGRRRTSGAGDPPDKWTVYERILAVPFYVVYDRYDNQWRTFELSDGSYRDAPLQGGRLWLPEPGLYLGRWQGTYKGHTREWLRFFDEDGTMIPCEGEVAHQAREAEVRERLRADKAEDRAEKLEVRLRALGIDPDSL